MLDVIYEDNHLLVVNKPAGLSTQTHGTENSLELQAKEWLRIKYEKPYGVFLEPIHRLDKAVSGIVVFAKTSKALSRLQEAMRKREIKKIYQARVEGVPKAAVGKLCHHLLHEEYRARVVTAGTQEAKEARLSYRVVAVEGKEALLEIELETGRYHQIRAQLSAIGHPIVGDKKYGAQRDLEAIGLVHSRMELVHPVTKEAFKWEVSPFAKAQL